MSALSKLCVGQDVGTSRPATAQPTNWPDPKQQPQQQQHRPHPLLHSRGFPPVQQLTQQQAAWQAPAAARSRRWKGTPASGTPADQQQVPPQHGLSSTLAQLLAASPPQAAAKAAAAAPEPPSSRPVTPHVTRPYRHMPALGASSTAQRCRTAGSRPATAAAAAGHSLLVPLRNGTFARQVSSFDVSDTHLGSWGSSSASRASFCEWRPGTASGRLDVNSSSLQEGGRAAAATAGALRPGSAAAAKILRAMDKACVATPSTAAARGHMQPAVPADSAAPLSSRSVQQAGLQLATMQKQLQQQQQLAGTGCPPAGCAPSSLPDTDLASDSAAEAWGADSRPSTAAFRSVLAAAAAADDGVEARLAAIHEKNSRHDHSAGLDIVYEEDVEAEWQDVGASGVLDSSFLGVGCGEEPAHSAAAMALGQQAAPMVLSLEDMSQCTPEVLEIELESLDVEQLVLLKHVLCGA